MSHAPNGLFQPAKVVKTSPRTPQTPKKNVHDQKSVSDKKKTATKKPCTPHPIDPSHPPCIRPRKYTGTSPEHCMKVVKPRSTIITSTPLRKDTNHRPPPPPDRSLSEPDWHEDEISVVSDISSILSETSLLSDATSGWSQCQPVVMDDNNCDDNLPRHQPMATPMNSKTTALPSERIRNSVRESRYLFGTFPKHLLDPAKQAELQRRQTANHALRRSVSSSSGRVCRSASNTSTCSIASDWISPRANLMEFPQRRESPVESSSRKKASPSELSHHLKYGIFGRGGRQRGASIKKSASSVECSRYGLSASCQKLQRQNEKLQNCLTVSQDRAIQRIASMKRTTDSAVDQHREMKSSLSEKDERITRLQEQLQNISVMGAGFSDTESIVSEASEYNDQYSERLRVKNARQKDKIRRLEEILTKCKDTIRNGIETTATLTEEKESLEKRLEKLQFENDELRTLSAGVDVANIGDLEALVEFHRNASDEKHSELEALKIQLNEVQAKSSEHEQSVESKFAELQSRESKISELADELDELKSESEKLKQSLHDHDVAKVMEIQDIREDYNGQITLLDNKVAALKQELEKANGTIDILKDSDNSLQELMEEMKGIRSELERVTDENTRLQTESETEKSESNKEIARLSEDILRLERDLQTAQSDNQRLLEDSQGLTAELAHLREERDRDRIEYDEKIRCAEAEKISERENLEQVHVSQLGPFKTKIKELREQITKLQDVKDEQDQEIADMTRHVFESNSDNAVLTDENMKLTERIRELETTVSVVQEQVSSKSGEVLELTESVNMLKENVKMLQLTNTTLQNQLDENVKEYSEVRSTFENEKARNTKVSQDLEESVQLINTLRKKAQESHEEFSMKSSQLQETISSLVSENERLTKEKDEISDVNEKLQESVLNNESGADVLKEQIESLEEKLSSLRQQNAELEEQLRRKNDELEQIQKNYSESTAELSEMKLSHEKLTESLAETKSQIDEMDTEKTQFSEEITHLKSENLRLLEKSKISQEEILVAEEKLKKAEDQLKLVESDLEGAQSLNCTLKSQISSLEQSLSAETTNTSSNLQQIQSEHEIEVEKLKQEHGDLLESINSAHREAMEESRSQLAQAITKIEELTGERDRLVEQLQQAQSQMEDIQQENSQIKELKLKITELETDLEIQRKNATRENSNMLNTISSLHASVSRLEGDLETSGTTINLLRQQQDKRDTVHAEAIATLEREKVDLVDVWEGRMAEAEGSHRSVVLELREAHVREGEEREERFKELLADNTEKLIKESEDREKELRDKISQGEDSVTSLITKLGDIEKFNDELQVRNSDLEGQVEKLKQAMAKAKAIVGELKQKTKEYENQITDLNDNKTSLMNRLKEMEDVHNSSLSEVQSGLMSRIEEHAETENSLKLEVRKAQEEIGILKSENEGLLTTKCDLEGIVAKHGDEKRQLSEILKSQMEELEGLKREKELMGQQLDALQNNQESEFNNLITNKDNQIRDLQSEKANLGKEIQLKTSALQSMQAALSEYQGVAKITIIDRDNKMSEEPHLVSDNFKEIMKALAEKNVATEQQLESVMENRDQIKLKLVELKKKADARIAELNDQKRTLETSVQDLKIQVDDLSKENLIVKGAVSRLEVQVREYDDLKNKSVQEVSEVRAETERFAEERDGFIHKIGDLESEINRMSMEMDSIRERDQNLEVEHEALLQKHSDLLQSDSNLQSQFEKAQKELNKLQENSHELKIREEALVEEKAHLSDQIQVLQSKQAGLVKEKEDLEELVEHLRGELSEINQHIKSQNGIFADKDAQITEFEQSIASLRQSESELAAKIARYQEDLIAGEGIRDRLQCENTKLMKEIAQQGEEIARLSATLTSKIDEFGLVEEEKLSLAEGLAERDVKIEDLHEKIQRLEESCLSLEKLKAEMLDQLKEDHASMVGELKQELAEKDVAIRELKSDMETLTQENERLSTHSRNMDMCLSSLKAEKENAESALIKVRQGKSEGEVRLEKLLDDTKKEHEATLEQINNSLNEKVQQASVESAQKTQNILQNQIRKLETSLIDAEKSQESQELKHSAIINEYSTKLLAKEKRISSLEGELAHTAKILSEKEGEMSDMISRVEHDEIVFNLEMAYNMNTTEQKEGYESQIRSLENKLHNLDTADTSVSDSEEVARLKSQIQSLTKQHRTSIDALRNEAIFEARQEFDERMRQMREDLEQEKYEEINRVMEDSSRERQRLVKEMEVLQMRSSDHHSNNNTTGGHVTSSPSRYYPNAGRISVSSENEYHLLDTEYEYLKRVLYKYLRGEHTQQLLKVIVAILRFSESEKRELLGVSPT